MTYKDGPHVERAKIVTLFRNKETFSASVGLMLGQRRRRWPNIKPTLAQYPMFCWQIKVVDNTKVTKLSTQLGFHVLSSAVNNLAEDQSVTEVLMTGPGGSFDPVVARTSEVLGSNPGRVCYSGCAYTVFKTVFR